MVAHQINSTTTQPCSDRATFRVSVQGSTDRPPRDLYWSVDEAILRRFAELVARIAAQDAVIAAKDARIAELEKQVTELLERLHRNSDNSNKPPSSDAPSTRAERRAKNKNKSGRKRGGQPGHEGSQRALVPPDQVDDVADHSPTECENCWAALPETPDPSAQRYQTTELPPTKLFIRR
jgi:transposase